VSAARQLRQWLADGQRCGVALLVQAQHSSPLPPGAWMAANEAGDFAGSVSMGCVEKDLVEHVKEAIRSHKAQVITYGESDDAGIEVGLSCGGRIRVLVMPVDPAGADLFEKAESSNEPVALITGVFGDQAGMSWLFDQSGQALEDTGGMPPDEVLEQAAVNQSSGVYQYLKTAAGDYFITWKGARPRLAIIGATALARKIYTAAEFAGFDPVLIDPRDPDGNDEQDEKRQALIKRWPDEAMANLEVNARWFVAVVTHDPKFDIPALSEALRRDCRYIGLLGGKRTQAARKRELIKQGFDATQTDRIHGPIGLDIHAVTFSEIALSAVAEMIVVRRRFTPSTPPRSML